MATFSDLVLAAQPAMFPAGFQATVQEGATWEFVFACVGPDGSNVDMTAVTGSIVIKDQVTSTVVSNIAWTITGGLGTIQILATPPVGIVAGAPKTGKQFSWDFQLTSGSELIQVWSGWNSALLVIPSAL